MSEQIIRMIIAILFTKAVCEKNFLRTEALKGLNVLPKKNNPYIISQLNMQTESHNGTICELAIKLLCEYMNNNQIIEVDQQFLRALSRNINGKRSVVQKKSKEIT